MPVVQTQWRKASSWLRYNWAVVDMSVVQWSMCKTVNMSVLSGARVTITVIKWNKCKHVHVKWRLFQHDYCKIKTVYARLLYSRAGVSMSSFQELNYEWMVKHCIMSRFNQVDKTEIRNLGFCVENCEIIRLEWTRRDGCQQAGGHCERTAAGYRRQLGECLGGRHESDTQTDGRTDGVVEEVGQSCVY